MKSLFAISRRARALIALPGLLGVLLVVAVTLQPTSAAADVPPPPGPGCRSCGVEAAPARSGDAWVWVATAAGLLWVCGNGRRRRLAKGRGGC